MMSKALSPPPIALLAQEASTRPAADPTAAELESPFLLGLVALGICVLAVWIVRRIARPEKLKLRNTPGRPNRLNVLHIGGVLLGWYGLQAVLAPAAMRIWAGGTARALVTSGIVAGVFLIAACLLVARRTFRGGVVRGFGLSLRHWIYDTGRGIVGYLAVLPLWVGLAALMAWLVSPEHRPMHVMLDVLVDLPVAWKAGVVIMAVVVAPIGEEMLFRGLIQSMIRRYTASPWLAIVIASALFAAVHAPLYYAWPSLFVLALALGYNYERCGRLYPSILIHAILNGVNVGVFLSAAG